MKINLDFDGTCVAHAFPKVGNEIGAVPVLKKLVANGHQLILFTMRANRTKKNRTGAKEILDVTGTFLDDAVDWFKRNDIPLYGIQSDPGQEKWTTSPKSYAHLMIDDSALGCPLKWDAGISNRPFVNWKEVEQWLRDRDIIKDVVERKVGACPRCKDRPSENRHGDQVICSRCGK